MQTPRDRQQPEDGSLEAPPALLSALKRVPSEPIFVPRAMDENILRTARRHLEGPREPRFNWLRFLPWVAAAAAAVVMLGLVPQFFKKADSTGTRATGFVREDLNHDGRVDILDAFALARQLKSVPKPPPQMDVNGDGIVDERDVATVAAQAVQLPKGGRS